MKIIKCAAANIISQQKTKNGIYYGIRYGRKNSLKLFNVLYKNAKNRLYLDRKYRRFLERIKMGGGLDG
ncbi:MAG: hypothetical protein A2471_00495 [Omnitrophica WOR_2 bacterium RIFOXYC2_FULL_45_15]|nr:MAG: hypothetical protein A2471_00495 [Omnitrophica WOR_2 bacterium RIFOXYC2_FULL_45_15]